MSSDLLLPIRLELDIPITRRQKLHAVVDRRGDQIFHSRRLSEVLTFLQEHEVGQFLLVDDDVAFRVRLLRPLPPKPQSKG